MTCFYTTNATTVYPFKPVNVPSLRRKLFSGLLLLANFASTRQSLYCGAGSFHRKFVKLISGNIISHLFFCHGIKRPWGQIPTALFGAVCNQPTCSK